MTTQNIPALSFKQFVVRAADRLQSHFSPFHHADTVAALWLCVAVQSDWSVRLKLSVPHCAQAAYSPAGRQPQNLLSNNSSGDAAHRLDSWPANQRDSYFKPHIPRSGPPSVIAGAVPCHLRGNVAWIKSPQSGVLHDMTEPPSLTEGPGGDCGGTVGVNSWICNSS